MPRGKKSKQSAAKAPGPATEGKGNKTHAPDAVPKAALRRSTRIRETRQALPKTGSALVKKKKENKQATARPKQARAARPGKALSGLAKPADEGFDHSSTGSSPNPSKTSKPGKHGPSSVISQDTSSYAQSLGKSAVPAKRASNGKGPQALSDGRRSRSPPPPDSLTEQALNELTRQLRSVAAEQQAEGAAGVFHKRYESTLREPRLSDIGELDSVELFNRRYGYLPPLGEEAAKLLAFVLGNPGLAYTMDRIGPEQLEKFTLGLVDRGVRTERNKSPDPLIAEILSLDVGDFLPEPEDEKLFNERLWTSDQLKCTSTSSEALFHRTLMVGIIARHFLIYRREPSEDQILDFSVEEIWTCLPMPTQALLTTNPKEQGPKLLTQPKPDLALSFNRKTLISDDIWEGLPAATRYLGCFENKTKGVSRVFHFLTIEAKGAERSVSDEKALLQCLNNSSQALFNLYSFFRDAGPDHERIFFQRVRVFSVVAMRRGFLMRCHRGIRLDDHVPTNLLVLPNRPTYRLRYEYDEVIRIPESDDYNREKMLGLLKVVLKYATEDLAEYIRNAAKALFETFRIDSEAFIERRNLNFYRYGQPSPEDLRKSAKASKTQTQASRATPKHLNMETFAIGSNYGQSAVTRESGSGNPTRRRPSRHTSRLPPEPQEPGPRKRRREPAHVLPDDVADDGDNCTDELQAQEVVPRPRKRHRRAPAHP